MTKEEMAADVRKTLGLGAAQSVLYAKDLAKLLGTTTKAAYGLNDRSGWPVDPLPGTGRPCVSIYAVVDWLLGEAPAKNPESAKAGDYPPVPAPKRKRRPIPNYLATLRRQMDFIGELHAELEAIDVADEIEEARLDREAADRQANQQQGKP
jgi:hypothetical protein